MIDPVISSAIITGASSLFNNIFNSVQRNKANRINQKLYKENREYNTPASQMARFTHANLSPHLIYTQQNTSDPPPSWEPPNVNFDTGQLSNLLGSFQNVNESNAKISNIKQQNSLLKEQIISTALANKYQDLVNKNYQDLTDLEKQKINSEIQNLSNSWNILERELQLKTDIFNLDSKKFDFEQLYKNKELSIALSNLGLSKEQLQFTKDKFTQEYAQILEQFKQQIEQFNQQLDFEKNKTKSSLSIQEAQLKLNAFFQSIDQILKIITRK